MSECQCEKCKSACETNPGWFIPEEARLAIQNGHAKNMMRDWLEVEGDERIYVLAPAAEGYEGRDAPEIGLESFLRLFKGTFTKGRCVMLDDKRLCKLHNSGFKPFQCKATLRCSGEGPDNYELAEHWDTDLGRQVIKEWQEALKNDTY